MIADTLLLAMAGLAAYAVVVRLADAYSRRTNWQPPEGSQESDWRLRRRLGVGFGGLAVLVCAVCSVAWLDDWLARCFTVGQAVLMAAAGASDLHRFHLPLPLTLAGLSAALIGALVLRISPFLLLFGLAFGLAWAAVAILLHALLSKGSMQLGDHIATIWIALAAPFNGLLALIGGDFANIILSRAKGLRGKKVAAAGAWLILATALIGMPPYFAWFPRLPQAVEMGAPVPIGRPEMSPAQEHDRGDAAEGAADEAMAEAAVVDPALDPAHVESAPVPFAADLITLSEWAGDVTARVGFAERRAERIALARQAARDIARLAALADRILPGCAVAADLADLSAALEHYDVDGVRAISLKLAEERQRLAAVVFTP